MYYHFEPYVISYFRCFCIFTLLVWVYKPLYFCNPKQLFTFIPDNLRCSRGAILCLVDCGLGVDCVISLGWVSLVLEPGTWAGFVLPFYRGVGLFNWSGCLVACLFWLWLSIICPVCGLLYDWFAGWQLLIFFSGRCPFSYVYRGGAVRLSVSLGTCFLYDCLWGIALLEINS